MHLCIVVSTRRLHSEPRRVFEGERVGDLRQHRKLPGLARLDSRGRLSLHELGRARAPVPTRARISPASDPKLLDPVLIGHLVELAPSILSADFTRLGEQVQMVEAAGVDRVQLDVMDGRFVPNISFGIPVIEHIKTVAKKPCEVHLMIEEPEKFAEAFKKAGADILIVHIETCRNLHSNIQQIKSLGMKAGVAINPHTPVNLLSDIICDLEQAGRHRIDRAVDEHVSVVGSQRLELVGGAGEGKLGDLGDVPGKQLGESRFRIQPGSDGGAALRQRVQIVYRQH